MDTIAKIIAKSRIQTATSVSQKTDAEYIDDLNIVYGNVRSAVNADLKRNTWQRYTADTVVWKNEYTIPAPTVSETGLSRVLDVSIKYNASDNLIPVTIHLQPDTIDELYTDYTRPYCVNRDDSIFIYPAPTSVITDWLIIEGNYMPLPLTLSTPVASIKLPRERRDILLYGINAMTFCDKMIYDKEQVYQVKYQTQLDLMLKQEWSDRDNAYLEEMPNLSYLE